MLEEETRFGVQDLMVGSESAMGCYLRKASDPRSWENSMMSSLLWRDTVGDFVLYARRDRNPKSREVLAAEREADHLF